MDNEKLLQRILDIGEEMLICGAEVSRVENSIDRMCLSYGATRINVFIITSNIQVTIESEKGEIITQIRRVVRHETNFDRLDYLNDLSRYICKNKPEISEIKEKFYEVMDRKKQSKILIYFGAILIASGFTIFFGGNWRDAISSGIMGAAVILMENILSNKEKNEIVYFFLTSFIAGTIAVIAVKIGLGENLDKIMIGGIMLLIPGIPLTNAIRDMLIGDTFSGVLRLVNSFLIAAAVACGFAVSIILIGGLF